MPHCENAQCGIVLCLVWLLPQPLDQSCILLRARCILQKRERDIPPACGELPPDIEILSVHVVLHHPIDKV